jgi:2-keto-4-pentenoate hydratase
LADTLTEELSLSLLEAERTRTPLLPLSDSHPDLTEQDSYQIQDALVATKEGSQVDYKLGFTSDAMREQMGIPDPNYRQLTWSMWVDADAGPIKLSELIHPRVEPEVALLVEWDLSGPGLTPAQVYPAIRWAFGALEVVDSRCRDYRFLAEDNTADNSSTARFVLGSPISLRTELQLVSVVLGRDGEIVDCGVGANAMGDSVRAVVWLANRLGEAGKVLGERSIVLTGGLTRAHPVGERGTLVAEFGGLKTGKVHFSREG